MVVHGRCFFLSYITSFNETRKSARFHEEKNRIILSNRKSSRCSYFQV